MAALDTSIPGQEALMFCRFFPGILEGWLCSTGNRIGVGSLSRLCQKLTRIERTKHLAEEAIANGIVGDSAARNFFRYNSFNPTTRPILTQNRHLGFAPALTQNMDIVCVLVGARTSFILRPSENGTYKIVGKACVRNIMFGETLNDERYPVQEILI